MRQEAPVYLQVITVKTQADLDRVLSLLRSGSEFGGLARQHSTHATAESEGLWGPTSPDELPGEIRSRIRQADPGELIHFFHPALGYAILRKLDPPAAKQALLRQSLNLGAWRLQRNEKDQALKELKKAVALDPNSAAAHQLLGQAYLAQGTYEMLGEAKSEFVQAIALDPDLVWARFYLARIYLDLGLPRKAKEQLEAALGIRPNVPHLLSLLGEAHRQLGDFDLAVERNRRALEADPSFYAANYYLGLAYLGLQKKAEAVRELETAAKSGPPVPDLYLTLGTIYAEQGDWERAIELFRRAATVAPERPEARLKLGQAFRLKKMYDQALEELKRAFPEGSRPLTTAHYQRLQADVFHEQGLVYQAKGASAQAIKNYTQALEFDPDYGQTHRQLAEILFQQGEYQRAKEHALKAEKLKAPVEKSLFEQILQKAGASR
ncbi:MAG: tetratricopeptide repeat protein [Blastocatellia bacterium]